LRSYTTLGVADVHKMLQRFKLGGHSSDIRILFFIVLAVKNGRKLLSSRCKLAFIINILNKMRKAFEIISFAMIQQRLGILAHVVFEVEEGACTAAFLNAIVEKMIVKLGLIRAERIFYVGMLIGIIGRIKDQGLKLLGDFHRCIATNIGEGERMRTVF